MTSSKHELPQIGHFVEAVRESSRALRNATNVAINPESIQRLLMSPSFKKSFLRLHTTHGLALPLRFSSTLAELNLLSTLSLLNFGSGYRVPLHAATRRGAFDNIRALVFGLHISSSTGDGDYLSARGMRALQDSTIVDLMGVASSVHLERPHESIPAVIIGALGGPIWELVKLITQTLNETGAALVAGGYSDLGSFILEALREGEKARLADPANENAECDVILSRLVRFIPAFQDMTVINGNPVYCFKKALLTIHAIALRFGASESPTIPIPRTKHLPIFSDNVIPSLLIHLGVIDLSTSSPSLGLSTLFPNATDPSNVDALLVAAPPRDPKAPKGHEVPKEGPVLTTEQAYILRAAAIDACELIVEAARTLDLQGREEVAWLKDITLPELDAWLWAVAKDREDYRKLERFVLRDTPYF